MDTASTSHHVVVGVDESDASLRAVRFAALEAARLSTTLEIVHVTPMYTPVGPALPMVVDESLRDFAASVLRTAEREAHETVPDLAVKTVLFRGGRVSGIVDSARHAPVLVVGTTSRSAVERIWTGATATGVAARASCPAVVVPTAWDPTTRHDRILVGLKSPSHSGALLARAFELAEREGSELVVLHAWQLTSGYDDIIVARVGEEQWRDRQTAIIDPVLAGPREDHPGVRVHLEVVHEQPARALVSAGARADRLLLSRPERGGFVHHLGAVARAVLREAPCPVEVVPPVRMLARSQ